MQELTLVLFVACIAVGAATMFMRRPPSGAYMISVVLSVSSLAAALTDPGVAESEGFDLTLMAVVPAIIFIWSIWGMLFGKEARRWRGGARPRTCSSPARPASRSSPRTRP